MTHIRIEGLGHAFGAVAALDGLNLTVRHGEFVVLLGPSGCGKTTLLRMIAGLLEPNAGRVLVDGHRPEPGRDTAMVFQNYRLIPWKTARQNVEFARPGADVGRYLEMVGLSRFADAFPAALSGGMRQRVALARALAAEAPILLMDEPFASLDAQTRELMQGELRRLIAARPATVVFVTHGVDEALALADRIVLMSPRPGRIAEEVRPGPGMREYLWQRLREMVLNDPGSDFYGREG
ncbi:ABC transporter ATP-binding protein [Falsirhodobacter xinxiangensis]|uniref:ABC transporter ATP-binding protein n=1 Tax=Falsirhodobacter xinxiangensis TaxID=2530049 RepID=UPI0010AAFF6F|nr:ABC transporter ATP-binding protein [Rhodobacter xinxiangensis]